MIKDLLDSIVYAVWITLPVTLGGVVIAALWRV